MGVPVKPTGPEAVSLGTMGWRNGRLRGVLAGSTQLLVASVGMFGSVPASAGTEDAALLHSIEVARSTRDEAGLQAAARELEARTNREAHQPRDYYLLARVHEYLAETLMSRKDRKAAAAYVDRAITGVQASIDLDEKSADAHSLLADLYGMKIGLGGFTAGAKYGSKVGQETQRALELEPKNPRAWASLGRQTLLAPRMFGGDVEKAIGSFKKSLELDSESDETWAWLARAYDKHGDRAKAREAALRARSLNPASISARELVSALEQ